MLVSSRISGVGSRWKEKDSKLCNFKKYIIIVLLHLKWLTDILSEQSRSHLCFLSITSAAFRPVGAEYQHNNVFISNIKQTKAELGDLYVLESD